MTLPANLGTPGLPNSRRVPNGGPAIAEVSHAPVLPAAGQSVLVTCRLDDPDGIGGAVLNYRLDPSPSFTPLAMSDDGLGADRAAGDGVYSAAIPSQPAGTVAAFHILAADAAAPAVTNRFPLQPPPAQECLVRFGETVTAGAFGNYKLWLTASNLAYWTARDPFDDAFIDATFVSKDHRAIYNAGIRYAATGATWPPPPAPPAPSCARIPAAFRLPNVSWATTS